MLEDVGELGGKIGRIDRDEGEARERGAEFSKEPLGQVRGPDRDVLTRTEARRKRPPYVLGFLKRLSECPAPPQRRLGEALDQCRLIGPAGRGRPQRIADRDVEDGLARVRGLVGKTARDARRVRGAQLR